MLAGAVVGGGLWVEHRPRVAVFGRAVTAAGLALLYFVAVASYHVAPVQVTENEVLGASLQAAAVLLLAALAVWRRRLEIALGMVLFGYLSIWIAFSTGFVAAAPATIVVLLALSWAVGVYRQWPALPLLAVPVGLAFVGLVLVMGSRVGLLGERFGPNDWLLWLSVTWAVSSISLRFVGTWAMPVRLGLAIVNVLVPGALHFWLMGQSQPHLQAGVAFWWAVLTILGWGAERWRVGAQTPLAQGAVFVFIGWLGLGLAYQWSGTPQWTAMFVLAAVLVGLSRVAPAERRALLLCSLLVVGWSIVLAMADTYRLRGNDVWPLVVLLLATQGFAVVVDRFRADLGASAFFQALPLLLGVTAALVFSFAILFTGGTAAPWWMLAAALGMTVVSSWKTDALLRWWPMGIVLGLGLAKWVSQWVGDGRLGAAEEAILLWSGLGYGLVFLLLGTLLRRAQSEFVSHGGILQWVSLVLGFIAF